MPGFERYAVSTDRRSSCSFADLQISVETRPRDLPLATDGSDQLLTCLKKISRTKIGKRRWLTFFLAAALLPACGGTDVPAAGPLEPHAGPIHPETSVKLAWADDHRVLVYRYSGRTSWGDVESPFDGELVLARGPWGVLGTGAEIPRALRLPGPLDSPQTERHILLPTFGEPLGWQVHTGQLVLRVVGPTPRDEPTNWVIEERVELLEHRDGLARIELTREGEKPTQVEPLTMSQKSTVTFDTKQGLYTEVDSELTVTTFVLDPPTKVIRFKLAYDPQSSAARLAELDRADALAEAARAGFDAYLDEHPVDGEIERACNDFLNPAAGPMSPYLVSVIRFYACAHPEKTWPLALALPPGHQRDSTLEVTAMGCFEDVPDHVVSSISQAMHNDIGLTYALAGTNDARLRKGFEWNRDNGADELKRVSTRVLSDMSHPTLEQIRAEKGNTGMFLEGIRAYQQLVRDPRDLFPVLIECLSEGGNTQQACLTSLERLAMDSLGDQPGPWQEFWDAHQQESQEQWIVRGTKAKMRRHRHGALAALARVEPFEEGRAVLLSALNDNDLRTRLTAAKALARWGDQRAAPVLLGFVALRDQSYDPAAAFLALAWLSDHTFGYVPLIDTPDENAAALGRWQEWLHRQGLD